MVLEKKIEEKSFLICYASQKGTAESIASEIYDQSLQIESLSNSEFLPINEVKDLQQLHNYSCVVFIGSTTGDGDPPDSAHGFMRNLKNAVKSESSFSWLSYTILGLGDTNYTNFCNFGKTLDGLLQSLCARRFYACGWADDGTGLEEVVEPWIEGLFPALKEFLKSSQSLLMDAIQQNSGVPKIEKDMPDHFKDNSSSSQQSATSEHPVKESIMTSEDCEVIYSALGIVTYENVLNNPIRKCKFEKTQSLAIPSPPIPYILVEYKDEVKLDSLLHLRLAEKYPFQNSEVKSFKISKARQLTSNDALKMTLELSLYSCTDESLDYEPGDSFGILIQNRPCEVEFVLRRIGMDRWANKEVVLSVDSNSKKKVAALPKFIPERVTLEYIFKYCLDIRVIPKKTFIRALLDYTSDDAEKRRMMEIVSKEGAEDYNVLVRQGRMTFLDFLLFFPSCKPSVSLLIEHLPRILPRSYSITSSPLATPECISFAFNVIKIPAENSVVYERRGLCTGWLHDIAQKKLECSDIDTSLANLEIGDSTSDTNLLLYFRSNLQFRLPKEISTPLIMIGPGTGVAPFIGFLKHRKKQLESLDGTDFESWLFFGCRNKDKDFLFEKEFNSLLESKVLTKLSVSFSRDTTDDSGPKYVQDNMMENAEEIVRFVHEKKASVFVCGDAKNMSRNVLDAFVDIFKKFLNLGENEARKYVAQLQMNQRYLMDVWA